MEWEEEDTDDEIEQDFSVTVPQLRHGETLSDILESFQHENKEDDKVPVIARRRRVLQSMSMALSMHSFSWKKIPQVEFVGEMADDYGGPKREFLRLLMMEVHSSLGVFEGRQGNLFFVYDREALDKKKYFLAGKLTAWSIFHDGPGPRGLNSTLYLMMCGQRPDVPAQVPELPVDPVIQQNIEKVWNCSTPEELQTLKEDFGDWIASCGMPAIYGAQIEDLPSLRSTVMEHYAFFRTAGMVQQYKDGFNSCGCFWQVVERNCMQFQPVFTNTVRNFKGVT
ncbi:G2/M phase-specific E3 ubiquitin-protein ligase [Austrofundulus limnaeus]|uniref:G2/M phase-specific E3 ubiquitin-protein ligase n=1 Tax=Austrofundulus limnaeus TaxID=52670 RepID=A0A2I4CXD7_AUSLI|nr:PREDICTED: G2/M phase-specific E3 ubiquitin-protein ligase-like [Austrofundulus limnaeus]